MTHILRRRTVKCRTIAIQLYMEADRYRGIMTNERMGSGEGSTMKNLNVFIVHLI